MQCICISKIIKRQDSLKQLFYDLKYQFSFWNAIQIENVFCVSIVMATRVKFKRTRNAVELNSSRKRVFLQQFRVLPNFNECYHNSMETQGNIFYCFYEIKARSNFLCFHIVMVNGFEPIRARVVSCLFYRSVF